MSTDTLERADIEVDVNLDDEIACASCDSPADYRISMKCCGKSLFKCARHHHGWLHENERQASLIAKGGSFAIIHCGHCGHNFGAVPILETVRINRIRGSK